jgi:hypothetical protein
VHAISKAEKRRASPGNAAAPRSVAALRGGGGLALGSAAPASEAPGDFCTESSAHGELAVEQ